MNYRVPHGDILAGCRILFMIGNKVRNADVHLVLVDAYSLKKMELPMNQGIINTLPLFFNESGRYLYHFNFIKDGRIIHYGKDGLHSTEPFVLNVYKENFLAECISI